MNHAHERQGHFDGAGIDSLRIIEWERICWFKETHQKLLETSTSQRAAENLCLRLICFLMFMVPFPKSHWLEKEEKEAQISHFHSAALCPTVSSELSITLSHAWLHFPWILGDFLSQMEEKAPGYLRQAKKGRKSQRRQPSSRPTLEGFTLFWALQRKLASFWALSEVPPTHLEMWFFLNQTQTPYWILNLPFFLVMLKLRWVIMIKSQRWPTRQKEKKEGRATTSQGVLHANIWQVNNSAVHQCLFWPDSLL